MSDGVIVTGASTGLGLETALVLAGHGYRVYAGVRDLSSSPVVETAAAERGVDVEVVRLDLTERASIDVAVDRVVTETGGVYALVNNGGIGLRGCIEDVTAEEARRVFDVNVFGTIAMTQAVLPHMRAAGRGRVITISSVGGRISSFGVGVYCASKFAQEGLGEALALELAPFGIQHVLIEPGIIKTKRWGENRGTAAGAADPASPYYGMFRESEAIADRLVERSRTTPRDVADAVHHALTTEKPRMRYVVGRPASVVIWLRRHLPPPVFEHVYWGPFLRRLQRRAEAVT
jgi:NAD(P)-dependent dehydrogenase (short-subunit alcohol dehydrogenase family)